MCYALRFGSVACSAVYTAEKRINQMANNDTMKEATKDNVTATKANGEILDAVPNMEWSAEEREAIRAIARALSTARNPVSSVDVVRELRKALAQKAKTTFYTPFETEYKNSVKVASRMAKVHDTTMTEYMHKNVSRTGWVVMNNLGCKLDVVPPKSNPASADSPVDTPKQ